MLRLLFFILFMACFGSTWADTAQDGICKKLPLDHPKRENQPPYQLRCEPVADGNARIQLLIDGEKPLVLSGVAGEPPASKDMIFDPASLFVRSLTGQPNLYWIRYGHRRSSETGGDNIDYRRDWVVQQGDMGRTLFDQWTEVFENNRSGHFLSATEEVTIEYSGSILRVISTRFRGEAIEDDIHEPGEPGYRESGSTESLIKVVREIDAGTGRVVLEKTIRAQQSGHDTLFLDDGISGWLVITKPDFRLVSWKPGEMFPRHSLPDPEKLEGIPPVAACWLYNTIPWDSAQATRNRPPAPPDHLRPDHFVPTHCCTVETSADGNWTFLYETKDPQEREKPGRLLAMFDRPSQSCHSINLAKDWRWGKVFFDRLGNPVFSPDGSKLGYRAKQGNRWFVVINDQRTADFDLVSAPVFSPDGQHVAYWARQDKKEFIVWDDRKGPAFDGAGFPAFSPDSGQVAYRAREGNQWFVMRGDEKGPAFDDIGYYTVPESGRGSDIADVVFSPDDRQLAYAARRGQQWFVVLDNRPGPTFEHVGLPVFGPDGRLAYRARQNDREFILLEGKKGPEFDFVGNPVFGPDGRQLAYWAQEGKAQFIVRGDRKGPTFDRVGTPVFNRNGDQAIHWVKQGEKEFVITGDKKGPEFDSIEAPVFNLRTDQIAHRVQQGNQAFVMLGDQKGPEFDDFDHPSRSRPLVFSPDGRKLAYATKRDGKEFILFGEEKGPAFAEVGDPVFSPDGGRLAYRAKAGERWFLAADTLEGPKPAAGTRATASLTAPLRKTVPTLIPHPVAVGDIIVGGATKKRWIGTEAPPDLEGGSCRPLDPERIPPGLSYRLYSFNEPLGECAGGAATACIDGGSGEPYFILNLPGCPVEKFRFAIAAPWNALPRRPKALKNHRDFAPIVRKLLDSKGLRQASVRIEYVHGIDLDGDGTEERIIHARSSKNDPVEYSTKEYSLLLLIKTVQGKPETTVISAWWPGEQATQGTYERYDSSYADANGDGIMEIIVNWMGYEESGIRVYTLQDGKPVNTELRFYEGI